MKRIGNLEIVPATATFLPFTPWAFASALLCSKSIAVRVESSLPHEDFIKIFIIYSQPLPSYYFIVNSPSHHIEAFLDHLHMLREVILINQTVPNH